MAMKESEYSYIIVESFYPSDMRGRHGPVHTRPLPGQDPYTPDLFVECSKDLSYSYPVGTKFRIKAKITIPKNAAPFIYSHYSWRYDVLK